MPILSGTRLRAIGLLALIFCGLFLVIQFIRPELDNPPVVADLVAPADVKQILVTSCYNCHSNETKLPWFDKIVPAYWLVVSDVKSGRAYLNFSDFNNLPPAAQKGFLYESVNQMQLGAMPPRKYTLVHPEAIVTDAQLTVLKNYLHPAEVNTPADPAQFTAADAQYQKWIQGDGTTLAQNVKPTLAGLEFFPDYKNWKPISTTDRFDNNTLRVILGNDVAIQAVAANNVHPWPDGAAFAKISSKQLLDDKGIAHSGEFIQVEFMVKDAKKYASTEGWGFGRWKTDALVPYGKSNTFANECAACHAPMHDNDFVYTMPIKAQAEPSDAFNATAALPDNLPYQPFQWKVINSFVDKTNGTMSTLYGNDIAVAHARTTPQEAYPAGAILSLVTWREQEDKHWFGGRIPGKVQSVEFVTVNPPTNNQPAYSYQAYGGDPLKKASDDPTVAEPRIGAIISQRAAPMP